MSNKNTQDKFGTEGLDVELTTANHSHSVTEEIHLPRVQECLEMN